jgi:ketosteroid isomerase-like protein
VGTGGLPKNALKTSRFTWTSFGADGYVVTLEYEVHGKILKTGAVYDNRFVSIAFIENRKIVRWRDYMDSLAAWTALTGGA